ncbi:hypothetical protein [Collimonas silvisoli]|uniref:hypothetical protein n=1 Tax=Collimonas silvisoli TaxID=2825884 RepID=UPI001B8BA853|nr:hypothetical protein [Collimonas silvisoli]
MHSPWKKFWLELFTSKSWDNGYSPGRIVGALLAVDIAFFFAMMYRIFYKGDEWDRIYKSLKGIGWFNLVVFIAFFLLSVHSIFKEKRGRQFLELLTKSVKGCRHK